MKDIADLAGVSLATVSRVLNAPHLVKEETRNKIQAILEKNNFIANAFARGLVMNSMKSIGVLTVDLRDLYFSNVVYNIEREFTSLGYNVILSNTGGEIGEKKRYLSIMLEKQVDGLILVGSVFKERKGNDHILAASEKLPIVMVNTYLEGKNIYSVVCDDSQGVMDAVNYLYKKGRENIYYLCDIKSYAGLAKLRGFQKGMSSNNLNKDNIIHIERSLQGGYQGASELISKGIKVSAIITGEDITAIGALKAFVENGYSIPDDVSVVGYNNSILAEVSMPTLTSIDSLSETMASTAVHTMFNILSSQTVSIRTVLTPNLIIRESTP